MENVLLIIHLIVALCLISVVLLQRSEGGALGIGGGGGGGLVTSRGAETALSKLTWGLAVAFIATSIMLTILSGGREVGSVFDTIEAGEEGEFLPLPDLDGGDLLPPAADEPETAPAAPATPPPAE
ncbi:MAG TPA: preprotein translocase subunit SecG [Thermohalobaculum sp.]|nr:preprotein translocase subunit SecG [Thermohalobaculum sp.]